jgi:peptide methionine sulfoxide reductase MsrA
MPATYEPIATTTLGSAASSITFSSIPATYTDLRLVLFFNSDAPRIQLNSDTGSNYSETRLRGDGSSASSIRNTSQTVARIANESSSSEWNMTTVDIFSYAGSTHKTYLCQFSQDKNGTGASGVMVGLWRDTSAINTILIFPASGNFDTGTTATLYGILRAT